MPSPDATFEALRRSLEEAERAEASLLRKISWVGGSGKLAYARDETGQLEIFLVGGPIQARERVVRERMVHDTWQTTTGLHLSADRLRLPDGDEYDAIAAAVLLELLDRGFEHEPDEAFRRTEALIALALEPAQAENAVLTGLAGELLVLASMIRVEPSSSEAFLDAWQGWNPSSRDFQLGSIGIEVKTSTTGASRHHIHGWYQVERGVAADGTIETDLRLLSIGIRWLTSDSSGATIESLVHEIVSALPTSRRQGFIEAVRGYCGAALSIDPDGTAGQTSLRRPFIPTYERLYDLDDDRIHLPRSIDLTRFTELVSDSVRFEIELPERVRGDRNPVVGLTAALSGLLGTST